MTPFKSSVEFESLTADADSLEIGLPDDKKLLEVRIEFESHTSDADA